MQRRKMKEREEYREFYENIRDIAEHPVVLRMKDYPHHGKSNCYNHCMRVAYHNYKLCKRLGLDAESAARAGMIHDLFLYDWHTRAELTGERWHGFTHPEKAYHNAKKHFTLNKVEQDVIRTHMWPLTIHKIPKTREGWITVLTDKYCGAIETRKRDRKSRKNML